eukprot:TRINITY_DN376_c0_g1_i1.p1 TRINITY_DN376_c0_g1~~TRINITY_DN376_c0_g1_i1.p1  ORF type:complete len:381 (-),score=41.60 TRINITY_DN376_c0_g1_i1:429-1571(-)
MAIMRLITIFGLFGCSLLPASILACSYVEIPFPSDKNTTHLVARTMELGNEFQRTSYIIEVVPAGDGGVTYGYLSPTTLMTLPGGIKLKIVLEGMNEKGLTISGLAFDESEYEPFSQPGKEDVEFLEVCARVLAHCDSVDSALRYLETVSVVGSKFETGLGKLHWAITDSTSRSVVVEYIRGKRVVSENHPRVMTNDPDLQWQWRNLNLYVNLSPDYPEQNKFLSVDTGNQAIGAIPRAIGHGWNLWGLPGDFSPPSRFVRLFYLRGYALRARAPKSLADAIVLGTALLNNVFIPFGTLAPDPNIIFDHPEYTPYAVLKSSEKKVMLIRGYRNSQWRKIDLAKLDFSKGQTWPLDDGHLGVLDITESGSPTGNPSVDAVV